jgi:phage terminase large subunit GpA-like protein
VTLEEMSTQRDALLSARYCGVRTVEMAGRRLTYATDAEMAAAIMDLECPIEAVQAVGAKFPAGYVHLPRGAEAEWVKQLVGEQLVTVKTKRGFARLEWQKLRERNEALDCRVYAGGSLDRRRRSLE